MAWSEECVRVSALRRSKPEPAPSKPSPRLTAYPEHDLLSDLVRETTADMVDLGIGEEEDDLLREIAGAIVELDLDGGR